MKHSIYMLIKQICIQNSSTDYIHWMPHVKLKNGLFSATNSHSISLQNYMNIKQEIKEANSERGMEQAHTKLWGWYKWRSIEGKKRAKKNGQNCQKKPTYIDIFLLDVNFEFTGLCNQGQFWPNANNAWAMDIKFWGASLFSTQCIWIRVWFQNKLKLKVHV